MLYSLGPTIVCGGGGAQNGTVPISQKSDNKPVTVPLAACCCSPSPCRMCFSSSDSESGSVSLLSSFSTCAFNNKTPALVYEYSLFNKTITYIAQLMKEFYFKKRK